jgi:DNA-binding transcriptional MerR regulator
MVASKSKSAFRTITEVADELGVAPHVLRFWETKFPQISPIKSSGGRRYYRPDDVELVRTIKEYLHERKYTIAGVQKVLKEKGIKSVVGEEIQKDFFTEPVEIEGAGRELISRLMGELKNIRNNLAQTLEKASK